MTSNIEITLDVEVDYTYHKPIHGARDSCMGIIGAGAQLEPDEPAWCEITAVKFKGIDVTEYCDQKTIDQLAEQALENP